MIIRIYKISQIKNIFKGYGVREIRIEIQSSIQFENEQRIAYRTKQNKKKICPHRPEMKVIRNGLTFCFVFYFPETKSYHKISLKTSVT